MSIFIHKDSRVVVQGVTGKEGAFWAKHMKDTTTSPLGLSLVLVPVLSAVPVLPPMR